MLRSLIAGAIAVMALGASGRVEAQTYYYPAPFQIRPAMPESMPTVSPFADDLSDTRKPTIAATPDCGAANPQHGIPSMVTGTCP